MQGIIFTPNSVKGVKPYEKKSSKKANSFEGKNIIKTVADIPQALEKTGATNKRTHKGSHAKGRPVSTVQKTSRLARSRQASHKTSKSDGKRQGK